MLSIENITKFVKQKIEEIMEEDCKNACKQNKYVSMYVLFLSNKNIILKFTDEVFTYILQSLRETLEVRQNVLLCFN